MKKRIITATMGATMLALGIFVSGCTNDTDSKESTVLDNVVDTIANAVAEDIVEATFAGVVEDSEPIYGPESPGDAFDFGDMLLVDSTLYAVYEGGVLIYDFTTADYNTIDVGECLNAVAFHEGRIYVGGENLYTVADTMLLPASAEFEGTIRNLYSYGYRLLIGTDCGLFSKSIFGDKILMEEVAVSTMIGDGDGLWVGTDGHGLYRWDGDEFKKRFLLRDTSIFDYVNALDFNHNHLYVGTDIGLFIYNGGRWQQLTIAEGLPSDVVRTVDASSWVIYIGTENGVISFFNGDFIPVNGLGDRKVNKIQLLGRKVIASTDNEGILMKSGSSIKTLMTPVGKNGEEIFSLSVE
ncbi:MAG: hypothetical protein JSV44_09955 [Candidatus Zixiibacteriota bacterium]|nr:MAG: hypothetical protein JSV44_09955 [candidate division Zixibacteria bacterium]